MKTTLLTTALSGLFLSLGNLAAEDGKQLYTIACSACHGANGEGRAGAAPPLSQSQWVSGDPKIITSVILHGLQGPIKIHGDSYDLVMPSQPALNDEQIAAIATYVRDNWGNKGSAIDADFVKQTRVDTKDQNGVYNSPQLIKPYNITPKAFKLNNLLSSSYPFTTDFDTLKGKTPDAIEEEKGGLVHPLQVGSQKEDGKVILERSKGTPASVGSIKLPKGQFEIDIFYAHEAKTPILFKLFISGPEMNLSYLHSPPAKKKAPKIIINPTAERALVHRNFFVKGGERTLGVGLSKKVNFSFSTQHMRLTELWKGEFLNVGKTWDGRARGQLTQSPSPSLAVNKAGAVFKSFNSSPKKWNDKGSKKLKQQFKGYVFDPSGDPIFTYSIGDYTFEDHFSVPEGKQSLVRKTTIKSTSDSPAPLYWKILSSVKKKGTSFRTNSGVTLNLESPASKPSLLGKDLVLPISHSTTITSEYVWK